jgi:hypothetical protein
VGAGKKIDFLGTGYPNQYGYFSRPTGTTAIRLTFGYTGGATEYFEILSQSAANAAGEQTHRFEAGGNAYHKGNLTLGGNLACSAASGCVNSAAITNGSVTGTDIAASTITGGNLADNITFSTIGNITAGNMYAKAFIDSDNNSYMADPASTSRFNVVTFDSSVFRTGSSSGLKNSVIPSSSYAEARLDHLAHPVVGGTMHLQYGGTGNVEAFTGGTGTITVTGTVTADIFRDRNNTGYYVDPASASYVNQFRAGNSYLNWDTDGRNYLRNNTYVGGTIFDEANPGYYLKPSSASRMYEIAGNIIRLYNNPPWPGGGTASYGFIQVHGGHLYMGPSTSSEYIIFRHGESDRFYWLLTGGTNTNAPSARTDGDYLVVNARAGHPLYLNLDSGGATLVPNQLHAGQTYLTNSDMYFTYTAHNHTGIGNTMGYAAIENAANYDALMILGRQTPAGRIVNLYDKLNVHGNQEIHGGSLTVHSGSVVVKGYPVNECPGGWLKVGAACMYPGQWGCSSAYYAQHWCDQTIAKSRLCNMFEISMAILYGWGGYVNNSWAADQNNDDSCLRVNNPGDWNNPDAHNNCRDCRNWNCCINI